MTAIVFRMLEGTQRKVAQKGRRLRLQALAVAMRAFLAVLLLLPFAPTVAAQEPLKGVALVIGQSDYEHLPRLENPGNDAKRVDGLLTSLGFMTDIVDNRSAKRLERDIDDFLEDAEGADVALIYYSGHGVEAGGENYLIPVDVQAAQDAVDEDKLVSVSRLLDRLRDKTRVAIVLLDACRSNPFSPAR